MSTLNSFIAITKNHFICGTGIRIEIGLIIFVRTRTRGSSQKSKELGYLTLKQTWGLNWRF
jgi:hypothetical protein